MLLFLFFLLGDEDPLSILGMKETTGAAAGYVEDAACGKCHPLLFQSYQSVGMSQSFKRPKEAKLIESFGKSYTHKASNRIYHIRKQGQKLIFHRHVENKKGQAFLTYEEEIDWVMGSGNRARSYLIQSDYGEMIQVPLGWYSEIDDWGMSPGFEGRSQPGLTRLVRRECMFCHNAFPEVPEGSDRFDQPHLFPKDLPQGTGCQRCHGPGAEHIRATMRQESVETIRSHIINPKKLDPIERDSVCFQCHMLPSVTFVGSRKAKHDYAFRPGQDLSSYIAHVEVWDEAGERFEINHHGYRFWQSSCFQKSSGALGCISCHDPHLKPSSTDFRKKVSGVCVSCHPTVDNKHEETTGWKDDCAQCHMPQTRTADVVLVTMTDHRIVKGPVDQKKLLDPLEPSIPTISDIRVLPFGNHYQEDQFFYRLSAPLRVFPQESSYAALNQWLEKHTSSEIPHFYRMKAALDLKKYDQAESFGHQLKEKGVDWATLDGWLGLAYIGQRNGKEAVISLVQATKDATPEDYYNLGLAYFLINDLKKGLESLDSAIEMRPHFFPAWVYRGRILRSMGQKGEAAEAFIQALTYAPGYAPAYSELVKLLREMGRDAEAQNYLELGMKCASQPELLKPLIRP